MASTALKQINMHYQNGSFATRLLRELYGVEKSSAVMKRLANEFLYRFRLSGPPFDPFEYADALGVTVEFGDIEADGVFISGNGKEKIVLRRDFSRSTSRTRRTNFTLAHEIGHFVIREEIAPRVSREKYRRPRVNDGVRGLPETDIVEERLCDIFAAELLMPSEIIGKDLNVYGVSPETMLHLSERYEVSLTALLSRVVEFSQDSLVAIIWEYSGREWTVNWSLPTKYKRVILCDTGRTTVERALESRSIEFGRDDLMLEGNRMKWVSSSKKLNWSNRVLTLMCRTSRFPYKFLCDEKKPELKNSGENSVQLPLPFE
jgi:hypothetical protein